MFIHALSLTLIRGAELEIPLMSSNLEYLQLLSLHPLPQLLHLFLPSLLTRGRRFHTKSSYQKPELSLITFHLHTHSYLGYSQSLINLPPRYISNLILILDIGFSIPVRFPWITMMTIQEQKFILNT